MQCVVFFENAGKRQSVYSVAQNDACHIQNEIVHVAAAQQREQLNQLNGGDTACPANHASPEMAKPMPQGGKKETQGNKHDHISSQIDKGMTKQIGIGIADCVLNVLGDGTEWNQIEVPSNLLPVGNREPASKALSKQKPDHNKAIKYKQDGKDCFFGKFHRGFLVKYCMS